MQLHVVKKGSCGFFGESGVIQIAVCMTFTKSQQLIHINQQKERYDVYRKWRNGVKREELSKRDDPEYTERQSRVNKKQHWNSSAKSEEIGQGGYKF